MIIQSQKNRLWKRLKNKSSTRLVLAIVAIAVMVSVVSFGFGFVSGRVGLSAAAAKVLTEAKLLVGKTYYRATSPKVEHLDIDIAFDEYSRLAARREGALRKGILLTSDEDFVPASIVHDGNEVDVKLRLKGDWIDHLSGDKWSFRVQTKGDGVLFGMKEFSLQDPVTRRNANEWVFLQALKREGLISLRYKFVDVSVNGEHKGIYALEEHFAKELVENNQRREGPILKFGEDQFWINRTIFGHDPGVDRGAYYQSPVEVFEEGQVLENEALKDEFLQAQRLLKLYREEKVSAEDVFDLKQWASLFALSDVFGVRHGLVWHGLRYYYNPVTNLLEPIAFDNEAGEVINTLAINLDPETYEFLVLLTEREFQKAYVDNLRKYSTEEYLNVFFGEINGELSRIEKTISRDGSYAFDRGVVERNSAFVRNKINHSPGVRAQLNEAGEVELVALSELPVEVDSVVDGDDVVVRKVDGIILEGVSRYKSREVQKFFLGEGWKSASELFVKYKYLGLDEDHGALVNNVPVSLADKRIARFPTLPYFVKFDYQLGAYLIPQGKWQVEADLVVPEGEGLVVAGGADLDLVNGASIVVRGPLILRGQEGKKVSIHSSDGSGEGVVVLNAGRESLFEYCEIKNLRAVSQAGSGISGAVTFYHSPIKIDHCLFEDNEAEDMLNVISSSFEIRNSSFLGSMSDAVDVDFGQGEFTTSSFSNLTNDAIDLSGSVVELENVSIEAAGDKGISAGESSFLSGRNVVIKNSRTAVASKDSSDVELFESEISGNEFGLAVYQKKTEFGPSEIRVWMTELNNNGQDWLVELGSKLLIDGKEVKEVLEDVAQKYYPY